MDHIAKFEKVSYGEFEKAVQKNGYKGNDIRRIYDNIQLPERSTIGSAGYDFHIPYSCTILHGESKLIPTGVRCFIKPGYVLAIVPRSGLGFKYGLRLVNTVGIIDSDYAYSDNEGHIMLKFETGESIDMEAGDRIAQGIFFEYGTTDDDNAKSMRNGGFGSTGA